MKLVNICPHCRKLISWHATRCPHCTAELPEGGVNPTFFSGKPGPTLLIGALACLAIWTLFKFRLWWF